MTEGIEPPGELPLFPIRGCILPPGEHLPLNVFEPRYLNMIDDAMNGDRHIGMVQPCEGGTKEVPALERIGTAGRIVSHSETEDGRYLIVLEGTMRFRMIEELNSQTPYRMARADYRGFEHDMMPAALDAMGDKAGFLSVMRDFFELTGIEADWDSIESAPMTAIVDKVAMVAPFDPGAKQSLLEAKTRAKRAERMTAFMAGALQASGSAGSA